MRALHDGWLDMCLIVFLTANVTLENREVKRLLTRELADNTKGPLT